MKLGTHTHIVIVKMSDRFSMDRNALETRTSSKLVGSTHLRHCIRASDGSGSGDALWIDSAEVQVVQQAQRLAESGSRRLRKLASALLLCMCVSIRDVRMEQQSAARNQG